MHRDAQKFQRHFVVNQFVRLKDTHQALAPRSSIRSSEGSTLTLVTMAFFSKASATTCRSMTRRARIKVIHACWSFSHRLVMLSPRVDHRRSATPLALKRTGASNGSLSLIDLFFLKAFARASRQR